MQRQKTRLRGLRTHKQVLWSPYLGFPIVRAQISAASMAISVLRMDTACSSLEKAERLCVDLAHQHVDGLPHGRVVIDPRRPF